MLYMENNKEEILREELPTHRFYYSLMYMTMKMNENSRGKQIFSILSACINAYYEESLALLRAQNKLMSIIDEQQKEFESRYLAKRAEINKALDAVEDEDDDNFLRYQASMLLSGKMDFYEHRDLENQLFTLGTIVQFLSSLESTLHSFYKKLIAIDTELPKMETVCKRDKGIIKYLKYFEKTLINSTTSMLIGTPNYQELYQWISFRNNIVHNNNDLTPELQQVISQRRLNISHNRGKFIFNESNVNNLADTCGKTLDVLIEKVFRPYFISMGVLDPR